jgi:hypothetical protein
MSPTLCYDGGWQALNPLNREGVPHPLNDHRIIGIIGDRRGSSGSSGTIIGDRRDVFRTRTVQPASCPDLPPYIILVSNLDLRFPESARWSRSSRFLTSNFEHPTSRITI